MNFYRKHQINTERVIFIFFVFITSSLMTNGQGLAETTNTKRALLIGIDKYKAVSNLKGAVNDVALMKKVLIEKFQFKPENIKVLKNDKATHHNIIKSIRSHLIEKTNTGDIVFLHFSGHGSQQRDNSGDEIDQYDETLVAYDSRTEGVFDITDDQINGLLKQITTKTNNAIFVFDSCHSGAATRGKDNVRTIEPDNRPPPLRSDYAISSRGLGGTSSDFNLNETKYVLFSGSLDNELANETTVDGRKYGVMTWFLAKALNEANDKSTYRNIMDKVSAAVTNLYPSQHPQLEGGNIDFLIFEKEQTYTSPYFLVKPVGLSQTLEVNGGTVHGLYTNALLKVFTPETIDFKKVDRSAMIQLVEVNDLSSRATLINGDRIEPGSKAILEYTEYMGKVIQFFINEEIHPSLKKITEKLEENKSIELVKNEKNAKLTINLNNNSLQIASKSLILSIPPVSLSSEGFVNRVMNQVNTIIHWNNVMNLKSLNNSIKFDIDLRLGDSLDELLLPEHVPPETHLTYRVHNRDRKALYIYVLNISSNGSISLLHPEIKGAQEALPVNSTLERTIKTFLPIGYDTITDTLKVIATSQPIDPSAFLQEAFQIIQQGKHKNINPPWTLLTHYPKGNTRGMKPVEVKKWETKQKTITVKN